MKKKGKYNTLLLVKAFSLEPNAPLIVTGLKEGVPPLGGQFIAATPLQICYIEGDECKRPSARSLPKWRHITRGWAVYSRPAPQNFAIMNQYSEH